MIHNCGISTIDPTGQHGLFSTLDNVPKLFEPFHPFDVRVKALIPKNYLLSYEIKDVSERKKLNLELCKLLCLPENSFAKFLRDKQVTDRMVYRSEDASSNINIL